MNSRLAALCLSLSAVSALAESRPNFLVIIADDLRPPGPGGVLDKVPTPRLDQLQREGLRFRNAYANFPACGPSRNSLLSGRRPENTGAVLNTAENIRHFIPDVVTLPEHFKRNGYTTIGMGKIFHSDQDEPSWTKFFKYPASIGGYQNGVPGERPTTQFVDAADEKYPDGWQAMTAGKWLREHGKDGPFLLMVGFQKPHLPFVAPQGDFAALQDASVPVPQPQFPPKGSPACATHTSFELRGYTDIPPGTEPFGADKETLLRRGYGACVHFVDRQLGKILDDLEAAGLAENTHVFVLGDHGFHFGENGIWGKDTLYEASLRTFLAARLAGENPPLPPGMTVESHAELLDLYPTLCQLAGIAPPYPLEGKNLLEKTDAAPTFSMVQRHGKVLGFSVRQGGHRYMRWIERETGKLVAEELYDDAAAVPESANLIEEPSMQPIRAGLSAMLDSALARSAFEEARPKSANVSQPQQN